MPLRFGAMADAFTGAADLRAGSSGKACGPCG